MNDIPLILLVRLSSILPTLMLAPETSTVSSRLLWSTGDSECSVWSLR